MIKRTVAIDNPAWLKVKESQLIVEQDGKTVGRIPVEDVGVLIVDHPAVVYTQGCLNALLENNAAVIVCGRNHHPSGLLLPLDSNSVQSERFRLQIETSAPLKKQLWQNTVRQKIKNQAGLLKHLGRENGKLLDLAKKVKSGDPANIEAQAARYYWQRVFGEKFRRGRFGAPPNNLLNYGYMVLRAAVARALVGSGLLPTIGIHHHNRYNAYCLADDIMEPYRVFVDKTVRDIQEQQGDCNEIDKDIKKTLLDVLVCDVRFDKGKSPLMVGLSATSASLARCFAGERKSVEYPEL